MRVGRTLRRALAPLALVVLGAAAPGSDAAAQSMAGTFSIALPEGQATLSLTVLPSGEVRGWMRSVDGTLFDAAGEEYVDEDGELVVEGTLSGPMSAEFELYEDDDEEFGLLVTPLDANGVPQLAGAAEFAVTRSSMEAAARPKAGRAADAGTGGGSNAPPGGPRDARLVGVWSTQVIMNSQVGSVATEMFMEFTADGVMRDLGSRAIGTVGGGGIDSGLSGGGEQGVWQTQGDVLVVGYPGTPVVPLARFGFSDGRLVLRYVQDGSTQIWSRVR